MSHPVLFIGGPKDGEWRVVERLDPIYRVPEFLGCDRPMNVDRSTLDQPIQVREHIYVLQDFGQGMHFKTSLYVIESQKDNAMKMLIEGYRRP